ncbi:hypothetical protein AOL_s00173g3 [Orbilia oligospora ATCC 24927]|uniref:Uncharacterized protein n=1 Tax=Arthrobotrys oligospora (strain ATCC 24927 / CBS 115.81 / DSM 1491) TaxID=756982 RepID=G1XNI5_ARTOA|nr:hypothetical protein AOL_s00173g3 [Orbilia oligospora ATCC 24927]EGX44902.1 hypothetical protein AOL_s00173g3 [Orbilia oligospora ATCC 24927]
MTARHRYNQNIHLLETKKKSELDGSAGFQVLESSLAWNFDNALSTTDSCWARGKDTSPDLLAAKYRNDASDPIENEFEERSGVKQPQLVYQSRGEVFSAPSLECRRSRGGALEAKPSGRKAAYVEHGESLSVANENENSYSQRWGEDSGLLLETGSLEGQTSKASTFQEHNYDNLWDLTLETSNLQDQAPDQSSFNENTQNGGDLRQPNKVVLSSLGIEPPRFKSANLQKYKRRRGI